MGIIYYLGMDVHKKTISYCLKRADGQIVSRGVIATQRRVMEEWVKKLPRPWMGAMEATMFTGWIYDFLKPHALELKVAHPEMLKAITAAKKKNDRADAEKLADLLRVNLLPECYMAPEEMRELRRVLRYRTLMMREAVRMKNKISGLLMETGAEYNRRRLHGKRYFNELLENLEAVPDSVVDLLSLTRGQLEVFEAIQRHLLSVLKNKEEIRERVARLRTIPGVGEVTALTWVLEVGDPWRFKTVGEAVSYCGLCSAQRESGGKESRGPISKKRNKHLQSVLIEAAQLAPQWNQELAKLKAREVERGHRNRATLALARKLAAYMLAVDKRETGFEIRAVKAA